VLFILSELREVFEELGDLSGTGGVEGGEDASRGVSRHGRRVGIIFCNTKELGDESNEAGYQTGRDPGGGFQICEVWTTRANKSRRLCFAKRSTASTVG
jgi:hypothetical protein